MMKDDICPVCGLPKDLCVCQDITKEGSIVEVSTEKRKFGKIYTIIKGLEGKKEELKPILKKLKTKLGCGGTLDNGIIELQGDHVREVRKILVELGYKEESIHTRDGK